MTSFLDSSVKLFWQRMRGDGGLTEGVAVKKTKHRQIEGTSQPEDTGPDGQGREPLTRDEDGRNPVYLVRIVKYAQTRPDQSNERRTSWQYLGFLFIGRQNEYVIINMRDLL